jgi:murein DD-endopeptidase MepM/ murein hydrolase activator NlpD
MSDLPQNTMYSGLTSAAYNLGQSANKTATKLNPKTFNNLKSTVQGAGVAATPSGAGYTGKLPGVVTTPFGGQTRYETFHRGTDLAAPIGTPINAFAGGTVVESVTGKKQGDAGFGNFITIRDDQNNLWRYSHLGQEFVPVTGTRVNQGQEIATMSNTGSTYSQSSTGTGSHLDIRLQNAYGKYVDPLAYIK